MKLLTLVFITLLSLLAASCTETTTISGMVTDSGTGLPLEGAKVRLRIRTLDNSGRAHTLDNSEMITGGDGQYALSVEGKRGEGGTVLTFVKDGYIQPYPLYPDEGDCIEYNRALNPIDAFLKLRFENVSGAGRVRYGITGGKFEGQITTGPIVNIPTGVPVTYVISVPGGGMVDIFWDTIPLNLATVKYRDSVYCARHDTTSFLIQY